MLSKKILILTLAVALLCFSVVYAVINLNFTYHFNFNQSLALITDELRNQVKKFDMIFEAEAKWWSNSTDQNRTILLGVLSAILIAGVITLAIINKQISQMTINFKQS